LLLATAASFTPGPNTTLSTALAAGHGLRAALAFVVAVPVGWTALLGLSMLGLGQAVASLPGVRAVVVGLGTAYLVWLAFRLWGSNQLSPLQATPPRVGFAEGVLLQFVNIKAWTLAWAVAAGWVVGRPDALARAGVVLPLMAAFGLASNLSYALVGSLLRNWLAGPLVEGVPSGLRLRVFNRVMAAALLATACWMVTHV
jgi:threonine/homoserine/homoserine lactone efflux protein